MDDFGVLDRLIYNQSSPLEAESLAMTLGMVHLYRTSGVHLLAFFSLLNSSVEYLGKTLGIRAERAKLAGLVASGLTLFWVWQLQDYRITMIRPIFTFLIRSFFKARGAKSRFLLPLILTLIFEFILSSDTTFTEGAYHYYVSVAGGLAAYHAYRESNLFRRHLALAVGSWLPIAIVSLVSGHLISALTPLYSLVSLPIISAFLYPFTLIDLLLHHQISPFTIGVWNQFIEILFHTADWIPSLIEVNLLSILLGLPIAILLVQLSIRNKLNWTHMLAVLVTSGLMHFVFVEKFLSTTVTQLDVGQGDSAVICDRSGRTEMIDVGSLKTSNPKNWIQKLSTHDVKQVDGILLSHLDEDHVGALKELLKLIPVTCVETNGALWNSERGMRLKAWIEVHAPLTQVQSIGCMRLPQIAWFASHKQSGNELMAGIAFAPNSHEVYLAAGDADEEQELNYEKYFQSEIATHPVRIWKVSHHGSKYSSNEGFLRRLAPIAVWISVGKHNSYHHPHPLTLQKLSRLNEPYYRTDEVGDVSRSFRE